MGSAPLALPLLGVHSAIGLAAALEQRQQQLSEYSWRFAVRSKLELVVQAVRAQGNAADIAALQVGPHPRRPPSLARPPPGPRPPGPDAGAAPSPAPRRRPSARAAPARRRRG
jgi:hypothetical protein